MSAPLDIRVFTNWLVTGERGLSSETIVAHLTGVPVTGRWHEPHDPDDLRRCELLLRQVPPARLAFPTMRTLSPGWAALVDAWDELVALLEDEIPDVFEGGGTAPRTYARMNEIRHPVATR